MQPIIETRIQGIPCKVQVVHYLHKQGEYSFNSDSDSDYYGFTECDFTVLDRKGYRADWLRKKMTERDFEKIVGEVKSYFNGDYNH